VVSNFSIFVAHRSRLLVPNASFASLHEKWNDLLVQAKLDFDAWQSYPSTAKDRGSAVSSGHDEASISSDNKGPWLRKVPTVSKEDIFAAERLHLEDEDVHIAAEIVAQKARIANVQVDKAARNEVRARFPPHTNQGGALQEAKERHVKMENVPGLLGKTEETVAAEEAALGHREDDKTDNSEKEAKDKEATSGPVQMNVLYVLADDFRPELSAHGRLSFTPNLDRLARRGMIFDRAYAQVTVCNPSRSSFMTGRKPDVTKVWHFESTAPQSFSSMSSLFATNGFLSLGFGKLWHWGGSNQWRDNEMVTGRPPHLFDQYLKSTEIDQQNMTTVTSEVSSFLSL